MGVLERQSNPSHASHSVYIPCPRLPKPPFKMFFAMHIMISQQKVFMINVACLLVHVLTDVLLHVTKKDLTFFAFNIKNEHEWMSLGMSFVICLNSVSLLSLCSRPEGMLRAKGRRCHFLSIAWGLILAQHQQMESSSTIFKII